MRIKNDAFEQLETDALEQLEKVDELQEENDRLNSTLNKLKGKHGDKETSVEVSYIVLMLLDSLYLYLLCFLLGTA